MIGFKSVKEPKKLMKHVNKLPNPIRGDVMTIAEQLAELVFEEKYAEQARQFEEQLQEQVRQRTEQLEEQAIQTAIKALEKGAETNFVADITGLSIEQVEAIKAENNL